MPATTAARPDQSPRELRLVRALADLIDAVDRQCFPNSAGPDQQCRYSMAVDAAMREARAYLPRDPETTHKAEPRDLTRPAKRGADK